MQRKGCRDKGCVRVPRAMPGMPQELNHGYCMLEYSWEGAGLPQWSTHESKKGTHVEQRKRLDNPQRD